MKKIILVLSLVGILGCNKQKEEVPNPSPNFAEPVSPAQKGSKEIKFQLREENQPNHYLILVSWPREFKNVIVEDNGVRVFTASSSQREFAYVIRDNTAFNLRVFRESGEGTVVAGEYQGVSPKDFVLSGSIILNKDLVVSANRVFLTAGASLQIQNYKLSLKAKKIFSEGAEILTFPRGQKAARETFGRDGGWVEFEAEEAAGHLRIEMRGEHGGDGADGLPHTTRAVNGAAGAAGAHDCARALGAIVRCWCTSSPGPGLPGGDGLDGRPGTNAGKGGNSGNVAMNIKKDVGFSVNVQMEPGVSGNPGHGSDGQEGGQGGPAGNPTSDACGNSYPGQNGKKGNSGADGKRPADGLIGKKCVSIGASVRDCE